MSSTHHVWAPTWWEPVSSPPALAADSWGIVPLGRCGELRWSLPLELSLLVGPPEQDAILVQPSGGSGVGESSPWAQLVTVPPQRVQILPSLKFDTETRPAWPPLTPREPLNVPAAVQTACRDLISGFPRQSAEVTALQSGILQCWDDLDGSHRQSQQIEGEGRHQNGDYWHAIMHRREPDYSNSKYWFRHVGTHPVFEPLAKEVAALSAGTPEQRQWLTKLQTPHWSAATFVNCCAAAGMSPGSPLDHLAQSIQRLEMLLLLSQTWFDAQ